jgi:hypothetical protein
LKALFVGHRIAAGLPYAGLQAPCRLVKISTTENTESTKNTCWKV